jgi:hypothetical protein
MILCGTGHRPGKLPGTYSDQTHFAMILVATMALRHYKPAKVISGMAMGWDMALAQAAVDLMIPLVAAIPFKGQERHWRPQTRRVYLDLLDMASEKVLVSGGGYEAWKMQARNEWMVDRSDIVLALWNGEPGGGTWNCIQYAKSRGKPCFNCWERLMQELLPAGPAGPATPPRPAPPAPRGNDIEGTMSISIINLHRRKPPRTDYVYIGRPRRKPERGEQEMHWGNPFTHMKVEGCLVQATREEAVAAYRDWLAGRGWMHVEPERRRWILENLHTLRGRTLGCFCKPLACHGDVLVAMLEERG